MVEPPPAGRRILITGIAGQLQGLVARALEQRDDVAYLVGVDVNEPQHDLTRTEFVRADIRNPLVARVVTATEVDTVLHLSTLASPGSSGGRTRMKEQNVIGAMQLLAAAQKAPAVRKVVVKSSTAVYGSDYRDPALFRETQTPRVAPTSGFERDINEVEGYARAFGRRRRDVNLTILRFANVVGGAIDSAFHRYFTLPIVPTILGYDPRLQFVHEDDALTVLLRSTLEDHPGIYNVAGDGVLYLSQAIRIAGRVPLPLPRPVASVAGGVLRRGGQADFSPEQLRFLQFGRVSDTTRLRERFGHEPAYTSREAFEDFVSQRRITGLIDRDQVQRVERDLYDFIQRKGQERFVAARRGFT